MSDLGVASEPVHSATRRPEPVWLHQRRTLAWMEKTMTKNTAINTAATGERELTDAELDAVSGGELALSHEATHSSTNSSGGGGGGPDIQPIVIWKHFDRATP